jgi:hypothetical protein
MTKPQFKSYIQSQESGLVQKGYWEGELFKISVWPISQKYGDRFRFFQVNSAFEGLTYSLTEQNFILEVNGTRHPSSVVIAENRGGKDANVLMVGFPNDIITGDFNLFLTDGYFNQGASFPFAYKDIKRLQKIKIKS